MDDTLGGRSGDVAFESRGFVKEGSGRSTAAHVWFVGQLSEVDVKIRIRELVSDDVSQCEDLLATLPEWFGFPDVNRGYVESLDRLPAFVAEAQGSVIGFIALERYGHVSAEIHVMAVDRKCHRQGIGRALVQQARSWCGENGIRWLHVKTRGPSTPDVNYDRTRLFYLAEGFEPLYESLTEWGPTNAALILIQAIHAHELPTPPGRRSARESADDPGRLMSGGDRHG